MPPRRPPPSDGATIGILSPAGDVALQSAFKTRRKRAALIPFVMGGFPNLATSLRIVEACVDAGADIIELGVPSQSPTRDGTVIQAASRCVVEAGTTLDAILAVAKAASRYVPVVITTYLDRIAPVGQEAFVARLVASHVSGLLIADLQDDQAAHMLAACDARGVALISFVSADSSDAALTGLNRRGRGFVYVASAAGRTGERASMADNLDHLVARAARQTTLPIAVGFGVSNGHQARRVADAGAHGVIVGSRLVRAAAESATPAVAVAMVVSEMSTALSAQGTVGPSRADGCRVSLPSRGGIARTR